MCEGSTWYFGLEQVFLYGASFLDLSAILVDFLDGDSDQGE